MNFAAEGIGFWDWELTDGSLKVSPEWMEMMGYDDSQLPNAPKITGEEGLVQVIDLWAQYVHPEDREDAKRTLSDYLLFRKSSIYNNQFRFRRVDGDYIRIFSNGRAEWSESGKLLRFRVNHVDVTELGGFDRAMISEFNSMAARAKEVEDRLSVQLKQQRRLSLTTSAVLLVALVWASDLTGKTLNAYRLASVNRSNPISATYARGSVDDIADFYAFYEKRDEIAEVLSDNLGLYADRAVFGYYEAGPEPKVGRIGAQAKRQSVRIVISEAPWPIDNKVLEERRDAHIKGQTYFISNPFAGLYDAAFQISAPGFWSRGDGPTIAWFVGLECLPGKVCDRDKLDVKDLKEKVDKLLKTD